MQLLLRGELAGHQDCVDVAAVMEELCSKDALRPRPSATHRRAQRHTSNHARRPTPTDLPDRRGVNLNTELVPTCGGLSLVPVSFCEALGLPVREKPRVRSTVVAYG